MENNYSMNQYESPLQITRADTGKPVATLSYRIREEPYSHLNIGVVASVEKRKGHFNTLYERAEEIARENNCKSIRLKTDLDEGHKVARVVFKKKGFVPLPQDSLDRQRGRIGMEKMLD